MRTTVDLEPRVLERAKRLAMSEHRTLGSVLNEALSAYLGARKSASQDGPLELIVRGKAGDPFPTPEEIRAVEEDEEIARLRISPRRRASP